MKKNYNKIQAFTLIELIVAISIFAIIMVSVMSIFLLASQTGRKVEISRVLQYNTKNIIENIAQDMRYWALHDVSENLLRDCSIWWFQAESDPSKAGNKLCLAWGIEYFLAQKNISGVWYRIGDMTTCKDPKSTVNNPCRIVKKLDGSIAPISNNRVNIQELRFSIHNKEVPRLTLQIRMHPSYGNGIRSEDVQNTQIFIQTSLSERIILHKN